MDKRGLTQSWEELLGVKGLDAEHPLPMQSVASKSFATVNGGKQPEAMHTEAMVSEAPKPFGEKQLETMQTKAMVYEVPNPFAGLFVRKQPKATQADQMQFVTPKPRVAPFGENQPDAQTEAMGSEAPKPFPASFAEKYANAGQTLPKESGQAKLLLDAKTSKTPQPGSMPRHVLSVAISAMLQQKGFTHVDQNTLEILTEICENLIMVAGRSTKNLCELSGRTKAVSGDAVVALMDMGIKMDGIAEFAKDANRPIIQIPERAKSQTSLTQPNSKMMCVDQRVFVLPALPSPHTYSRTPAFKEPITEYAAIREKAAQQKMDTQKALVNFMTKTQETVSLFDDPAEKKYSVLVSKPKFPPWLSALNPMDQIDDFSPVDYYEKNITDVDDGDDDKGKRKRKTSLNTKKKEFGRNDDIIIDNPFLRAPSLPKRHKSNVNPLAKMLQENFRG